MAVADIFEFFTERYAEYGYLVLFFGVLLENAGVPVPGETAVLIAGFLASPVGGASLKLAWIIPLAIVAAVVGDNLGFWLGRRFARPRLQTGRGFLLLTPRTLRLAENYFERYGLWTIFFARFITGLRVIGALAAGTAGMRWPRFLVANACGAIVWATTMTLVGYYFGHSWELVHSWLGRGSLILLGCLLAIGAAAFWRHRRNAGPPTRPWCDRRNPSEPRNWILDIPNVVCWNLADHPTKEMNLMTAPTYEKLTPPKQGTRVTVDASGHWNIPDDPIVCLLRGDGIGRDVGPVPGITTCAVRVLDAAVEKAYKGKRQVALVRCSRRRRGPRPLLPAGQGRASRHAQRGRAAQALSPDDTSKPSSTTAWGSRAR